MVTYGMLTNGPFGFKVGSSGEFFVSYSLTTEQQIGVALSILKLISETFEWEQGFHPNKGVRRSSFSEEDLVSDLLAMNVALLGIDGSKIREVIGRVCGALDIPKSQHIYKDNYGEHGSLKQIKTWTPNYYDAKDCKYCPEESKHWPNVLFPMRDIPKGRLWRYWHNGKDYLPGN